MEFCVGKAQTNPNDSAISNSTGWSASERKKRGLRAVNSTNFDPRGGTV
jgi:hypothetical protein